MSCNRLLSVFNFSVFGIKGQLLPMQMSLTSISPFRVTVTGSISV